MIVRRPAVDEREIVDEATIEVGGGLVGDNWKARGSRSTEDGGPDPREQVTVTSWRAICLIGGTPERCALAGDQLYVDLDLSHENLPPGTRLTVGSVVLEVSGKPHRGCSKFKERFGVEALRFVNVGEGGKLRLRGINTTVVEPGTVHTGDSVRVERP